MSHSEVIRTSSLAQSPDHVPDLLVSPASPQCSTPPKEFAFEAVMVNSPPPRKGIKYKDILTAITMMCSNHSVQMALQGDFPELVNPTTLRVKS